MSDIKIDKDGNILTTALRFDTLDDNDDLFAGDNLLVIESEPAVVQPSGGWRDMQPNIVVEEHPSFQLPEGPPLRGTCTGCGADLDALRKRGVIGHTCFGPGDVINTEEPS